MCIGADADAAAVAAVGAGVDGEAAGAVAAVEAAAGPGVVAVGARSEGFPGQSVHDKARRRSGRISTGAFASQKKKAHRVLRPVGHPLPMNSQTIVVSWVGWTS
jgi:hypothetical protein